jgi:hypothetical protein
MIANINEKTSPIVSIGNNNKIFVDEENLNNMIPITENKLIIIGAVGKMRLGKSTALNNFYTLLTGHDIRLFSEKDSPQTDTRGIHVLTVKFSEMNSDYQNKLEGYFGEKIDVVLLDCEGTESSDNVGTSKLYLINMLINSMIHIHVSKAIDKNFADKLSQALISSNQVIQSLGGSLKEILPGLKILIKDTTLKGWENAKQSDPSLRNYEDLLKKYPNLYEYYKEFPESEINIVTSPPADQEGNVIVNDFNSLYWKQLELIFLKSISFKKLKTREELLHFIKNVARVINEDNLMNVKSELESFYSSMFISEKNKLLVAIVKKCLTKFPSMIDFSPQEIKQTFILNAEEEIEKFHQRVENISCKWVFKNLKEKLEEDINKIISKIEDLFQRKMSEYKLKRENTKVTENIYEDKTTSRPEYEVIKSHDNLIYMCQYCGQSPSSKGCIPNVSTSKSGGNIVVQVLTLGFMGGGDVKVNVTWSHRGPCGEFCSNCRKDKNSKECQADISTTMKDYTETVLTGFDHKYTLSDWSSTQFKDDFGDFLQKLLNEYQ